MFGIGTQELLLILVLALVVFGPKRLPELARMLGKGLGEFRRATNELKQTVEADEQFQEVSKTLKEAKTGVTEMIEESARQTEEPTAEIQNTAFETMEDIPEPVDDETLKARFLEEAKEELRAGKTAEAPGEAQVADETETADQTGEKIPEKDA